MRSIWGVTGLPAFLILSSMSVPGPPLAGSADTPPGLAGCMPFDEPRPGPLGMQVQSGMRTNHGALLRWRHGAWGTVGRINVLGFGSMVLHAV